MGEIRNCPNGTAECNNQLCPSLSQCSLRQITAQRTLRLRQELRADPAVPAAKKQTCLMSKSRSEEHTSELQSIMRISYAVFCLKKKIEPAAAKQYKKNKQKIMHTNTKYDDTKTDNNT